MRRDRILFRAGAQWRLTPKIYSLREGDELLMRKASKGVLCSTPAAAQESPADLHGDRVAPYVSFVRTLYKDWNEGKFKGEHTLYLLNGRAVPGSSGTWKNYRGMRRKYLLKYVPT